MTTETHLMIDTETFGIGNSAGLVQLGACPFTLDLAAAPLPSVEWTITLQSSLLLGGEIDAGTIGFWRKQAREAQDSISIGGVSIGAALAGLQAYWTANDCTYVWSHGATFDIPILGGYFARAGMTVPWSYSNCRDTRTLFDLAERLTSWRRDTTRPIAHTAAADAIAQAQDVQAAWAALKAAPATAVPVTQP